MKMDLSLACVVGAVFGLSIALAAAEEGEQASPNKMLVVPEVEPRTSADEPTSPEPSASPTPSPGNEKAASEESEQSETKSGAQDPDLPAPAFPVSRYEPVWERSPFQVESTAPPPESAALSQSYALTGIAQINGDPIIFILDRATQMRHMIDKKKGFNDLSLVQVEVQKEYAKSTATIRKGGEVGVIQFDAVAAGPMAAPPAGIQMPQRPGLRPGIPVPVPAIPVATQAQAQPVPGIVPAVPGPTPPENHQMQTPAPGQPQMPPPRVIRRRAVVPAAP